MEAVGGILAFASMGAFLVGLASLIYPIRRVGIPTRKRALAVIAGSFVAMIIAGSMLPHVPKTPEQKAQEAAIAAKSRADAAKAESDTAEAAKKTEQAAKQKAKDDVRALWGEVKNLVGPCDTANTRATKALDTSRGGNIYAAYEAADFAEGRCTDAYNGLARLDTPASLTGEVKDIIDKSLKACENAYLFRQIALGKLKTVLDGDMRPSAVQDFKESAQTSQAGVMACVAGFMEGGLKVGLSLDDFK